MIQSAKDDIFADNLLAFSEESLNTRKAQVSSEVALKNPNKLQMVWCCILILFILLFCSDQN